MGSARAEFTVDIANNRFATSIPAEKGNLVALSAKINDIAIMPGLIFVKLSLSAEGSDRENATVTIAEGYICSGKTLNWTGSIPLTSGNRIMAEGWGRVATTVIVNAVTV